MEYAVLCNFRSVSCDKQIRRLRVAAALIKEIKFGGKNEKVSMFIIGSIDAFAYACCMR